MRLAVTVVLPAAVAAACLVAAGCTTPGIVLQLGVDAVTNPRIDSYCVNLGADGARRFGRSYAVAHYGLPQTLGVDAGGRAAVEARLDGLAGGLVVSSVAAQFPLGGGIAHGDLELTGCVATHTQASGATFHSVSQLTTIPAADRLAIVRTGAELAGGAEVVALTATDGVRQRFGGAPLADGSLAGPGGAPLQLLVLDVDGDCADDLLVAAAGQTPQIWPSAADGGLAVDPSRSNAVQSANAIAVADLDGDALPDLFAVGDDGASVLLGDDQGRFTERVNAIDTQPTFASAIALGDLDGDGKIDALVGFEELATPLRWLGGDGHGGFAINPTPLPGSFLVSAILLRDLDGDGDLDALVAVSGGASGLRAFANDGHGNFTDVSATVVPADVEANVVGLLAADLDGDCVEDLLVLGQDGAPVLLGVATGQGLVSRGPIGTTPVHAAAAGDLDGDGLPNLVLADASGVSVWTRGTR